MVRQVAFSLLTLGLTAVVFAQGPEAAWRTLETPHFRVHYTVPAQAWAQRLATRLEAIRERVITEVGYAPRQVVDVVVADPIAQPNGVAIPLLDTPRMVLWTSSPGPTADLGEYTDWTDLLVVHEETHLVHMLRPSRSPMQRVIEALLPLGPIWLRAPLWIREGYATLVEGRLTGSGRPNGDLCAVVLRQRARAGKLPTYRQMANDSQSWLGTSIAYLAGSAYLEWLEQRAGADSLRHLWARLTARADRSFDAAFEGVFGEAPEKLYGRFTAELTWRAMEAERRLERVKREGELWQDLAWSTGEPALSCDGKLMAIVLRYRQKPSRIVIWSTGANDEVEKEWRQRAEKLAKRDPEDVTPIRTRPLPRKPLHELVTRNGAEPSSVRFMPDGESVQLVRFEPDEHGFLHPDLFRWAFETGAVTRVTRLADVREADPSPDGAWAVAVRNRFGFSQLVRVDLASGVVTDLTPPSLENVCASPRLSPNGQEVVFDRHEEGAWSLVVRELGTGQEWKLAVPLGATVAAPAWSADGMRIFASLGHDGFVDVVSFDVSRGGWVPVTATVGAALAPAPTPDGRGVFYLSLQAEGLALRYLAFAASPAPAELVKLPTDLAPAVRPVPPTPSPLATATGARGHDYGFGRQELMPLLAGTVSPSARLLELGLRAGDIVGRLDVLAVGALAEAAGPRGGLLGATWRGWPVSLALQVFAAKERPSAQPRSVPGLGATLDVERRGMILASQWQREWRATSFKLGGGALASRILPAEGDELTEREGFVTAQLEHTPSVEQWRFPNWFEAQAALGRTGDDSWRRYSGGIRVGVEHDGSGLSLLWRRERVRDATSDFDRLQLGGVATSVLPAEAVGSRVVEPALPFGTRIGDEHEEQRATLDLGGLPFFFARHRVWTQGGEKEDWLRLAGVEWDLTSEPLPIVRLPGFHFSLGLARILDPPFKNTSQAWLSLAWRP